jgi:ABC-type uncharacterized transport system permease subunit
MMCVAAVLVLTSAFAAGMITHTTSKVQQNKQETMLYTLLHHNALRTPVAPKTLLILVTVASHVVEYFLHSQN